MAKQQQYGEATTNKGRELTAIVDELTALANQMTGTTNRAPAQDALLRALLLLARDTDYADLAALVGEKFLAAVKV